MQAGFCQLLSHVCGAMQCPVDTAGNPCPQNRRGHMPGTHGSQQGEGAKQNQSSLMPRKPLFISLKRASFTGCCALKSPAACCAPH